MPIYLCQRKRRICTLSQNIISLSYSYTKLTKRWFFTMKFKERIICLIRFLASKVRLQWGFFYSKKCPRVTLCFVNYFFFFPFLVFLFVLFFWKGEGRDIFVWLLNDVRMHRGSRFKEEATKLIKEKVSICQRREYPGQAN